MYQSNMQQTFYVLFSFSHITTDAVYEMIKLKGWDGTSYVKI